MGTIVICKWVRRQRKNRIRSFPIVNSKWEFWIPFKMDRPHSKSLSKQKRDLGPSKIHKYKNVWKSPLEPKMQIFLNTKGRLFWKAKSSTGERVGIIKMVIKEEYFKHTSYFNKHKWA